MAEITANGSRVTLLALAMPRIGAWVADLDVDTSTAITGSVAIVVDGETWTGTVHRGGLAAGSWRGRVVGGAGGLSDTLAAVALRGSTLADVLGGVLREAGETLSSAAGALTNSAALWHRIEGVASTAVADVARAAGYAWRVLPDGTVWVGSETWSTFTPSGAVDVIEELPEAGRVVLAGDVLDIRPGTTLALTGRDAIRVGQVDIRATPRDLRATVTADGSTGLGAAVDAVVRRALRRVDYLAHYPARVVSQSASGLLDLVPDDPRIPPCSGVPVRHGLPGVTVVVPAGERVTLAYEGGDPSKPVAVLWTSGTVTRIVVNGASARAAREGDDVTRSAQLQTWMSAVTTATGVTPFVGSVVGTINEGSDALRLP
jgi:hypothetical protein